MPATIIPTEPQQVRHWELRQAIMEAEEKKDAATATKLKAELTKLKAGKIDPPAPPPAPVPTPPVATISVSGPTVAPNQPAAPPPADAPKPGE